MKKNKKSKAAAGNKGRDNNDADTEEPMLEERFAAAETRPHFRTPTVESNKVVLDERFSSVLSDPRFQLDEKDKYGRDSSSSKKKNSKGQSKKNSKASTDRDEAANQLKDFYVVRKDKDDKGDDDDDTPDSESSSSSDEDNDNDVQNNEKKTKDDDDGGKVLEDPESRIAYLSALSRGELDVSSSSDEDGSSVDDKGDNDSDDDDEDDSDDGGEDPVYGTAGVLDPSTREQEEDDVELSYDPSPYLVVTNMDWENIRAVDLFVIMSSFAPPGSVNKVQVYQSDFGIEQMAKDKLQGPSDIWKQDKNRGGEKNKKSGIEDNDDDDDDSSKSSSEDSDDQNDVESDDGQDEVGLRIEEDDAVLESDFDPEKLRAYEASKLKYYFAVVKFAEPDHADIAYREVDGMEFEHSSAAADLRTIPTDALQGVMADRPLRDEATSVPGNYEPPDFVVSALQQTNVQCTWDQGDNERERKLTSYSNWQSMDEMDDLKAYLASDASSDEEEDSDNSDDESRGKGKGSRMRKLLGLDDDEDDDDDDGSNKCDSKPSADRGQSFSGDDDSDHSDHDKDEDDDEGMSKTIKFIPGQKLLEQKIRSKLDAKDVEPTELTPWQKYQEKRKQKRRERRQASRGNRRGDLDNDSSPVGHDLNRKKTNKTNRGNSFDHDEESVEDPKLKEKRTKEQLELLLAGDHNEELARDFNIRGIQRLEKNKDKKFTGSRKRKEAKVTSDIAGADFKLNVEDDRFKAVLDGSDDRFGIDKTDPNYKDTSAMREILTEQTKRRKKKRRKTSNDVTLKGSKTVPVDVSVDDTTKKSSGANALSSLVKRMKQLRDFNIRGIQRLEKNKDKKFTGSRKRKEAKATSDIAGTDFKLNVEDDRFKAVLDGSDDRFGIDKTDSNYKDTSAMREILTEQTKRRKKKRQKTSNDVALKDSKTVPLDVSVDDTTKKSSGANLLSS
eukprot:CAMPEP_0113510156 /NCGR_PEP_ID=MMETSP0014_2-20120614/37975_1 /TAXON_ID=2857 /ORGANISM="Nitzschia sp." /LENGTH=949 /DNA_ID=CAMNT_0000406067 /DNA_START=2479 /DNA_END=5325 /DNA_ORIENTATION=+ /assembly_acc=CAM_ASM_000159